MSVAIQGLTRKPQSSSKRVRHAVNTALAFIDTAIRNLSGSNPEPSDAKRMYEIGRQKLAEVMNDLDQTSVAEDKELSEQHYIGIQEQEYTANHRDILHWTEFFHSRVRSRAIFESFERAQPKSFSRAKVVGVFWHRFSSFMPWFLCEAAARVSTNEKRHYVIQTAFEELGMRDVREIHPKMFWETAVHVGITESDKVRLAAIETGIEVLNSLRASILMAKDDETVMGLLLGLEIPAQENIETVFASLAHSKEAECELAVTKFFRLHRQIEIEHVRLTVSNFLRFCLTEEERARFIDGFDQGTSFWEKFWANAADTISIEATTGRPNA